MDKPSTSTTSSDDKPHFNIVRPKEKLTVSPYVRQVLKHNKVKGERADYDVEFEYDDTKLSLEQTWILSEEYSVYNKSTLLDLELSELQSQYGLLPQDRGKWNLYFLGSSQEETETFWVLLKAKIKDNSLPGCNCVLKDSEKLISIYCSFGHSLKVYDSIRKMRPKPVRLEYTTAEHGVLIIR